MLYIVIIIHISSIKNTFLFSLTELGLQFECLPDGRDTNDESFYGGPFIRDRPHSPVRPFTERPSFPAKLHSPVKPPYPDRASCSGRPSSQQHILKIRKKFIFPITKRPLYTKLISSVYKRIIPITHEYSVITFNNVVLVIVDKKHFRHGIYNRSNKRLTLNMVNGRVNYLTEEERALCPVGCKFSLNGLNEYNSFLIKPRNGQTQHH